MSTTDDIVDPAASPPSPTDVALRRRRRRFWWIVGPLVALLVAGIVSAVLVPLPYYAIRPGAARPTQHLIEVENTDIYESGGDIYFTTVSLKQVTLLEMARGWLDDDIEVRSEREIFGDRNANENRQFNQQLMDNSKLVSTRVALQQLGYDVPITVTGETVVSVDAGTPADGILSVGDVIVASGGERLDQAGELTNVLSSTRPGDAVTFTIDPASGADERDVTIDLGQRPDDAPQGYIGVSLQPRDLDFVFPFPIEIDSGDVGGPSAGLAFTLSVLELLTPGDLTAGRDVAVTGTIDADGNVGPVGGVAQKAAAVRRSGIELFLVPPGEFDDAVAHAGSGVRVVEVSTLEEALEALDDLGGNALALGTPGADQEVSAGS